MHKTIILGSLKEAPVLRETKNGTKVCNFSIASNQKNGQSSRITWFRITAWERLAENCEKYLHKGSYVFVEGKLIADRYTGSPRVWKSHGKTGASFELTADTVRFLDRHFIKPETTSEVIKKEVEKMAKVE